MATDSMVEIAIVDGRKLVEELPERGFHVTAAFWFKASENGKWYFYIVSPLVDTAGSIEAYRALHPHVRAMPELYLIGPLKIGPSHPIARDVLVTQDAAPDPHSHPIRLGSKMLGDVVIDEAYLYPLPAATP